MYAHHTQGQDSWGGERGHLSFAGIIRSESKQLAVPSSWRGTENQKTLRRPSVIETLSTSNGDRKEMAASLQHRKQDQLVRVQTALEKGYSSLLCEGLHFTNTRCQILRINSDEKATSIAVATWTEGGEILPEPA
jgi:hypothetical protein